MHCSEQRGADSAAARMRVHAWSDVAALGIVRAAAEPGADDLSVELGDERSAIRSGRRVLKSSTVQADSFGRTARLTRIQPSRSASLSARRTSIIPTA